MMRTCAKAEDKSRRRAVRVGDLINTEPIPLRKSMIGDSSGSPTPSPPKQDTKCIQSHAVGTLDKQGQGNMISSGVILGNGDDNVSGQRKGHELQRAWRTADSEVKEIGETGRRQRDQKIREVDHGETLPSDAISSKSKPVLMQLFSWGSFMSNDGYDYMESEGVELPANCSDRKGYDRSLSALEKGGNIAGSNSDSSSFNGDEGFSDGDSSTDSRNDFRRSPPTYRGMYSIASGDGSDGSDEMPPQQSRPMEAIRRVLSFGIKKKDCNRTPRKLSTNSGRVPCPQDTATDAHMSAEGDDPTRLRDMLNLEATVHRDRGDGYASSRRGLQLRVLSSAISDVSEYDVAVRGPSQPPERVSEVSAKL